MKNLVLLGALALMPAAQADIVERSSELALLPPYCLGTQQIRSVSQDATPIETYKAIYGKSFQHLHHYCWALNTENKYVYSNDRFLKNSKLASALGDIQYFLDRAEPGFLLLPEIYTSQARILFTLRREPEAVIALKKAIDVKPDYVRAILSLSDYYESKGDRAQAIKILEQGIDQTEAATTLIKQLEKLGKIYQGTPGQARKPDTPPETTPPAQTVNEAETATPAAPVVPPAVDSRESMTEAQKKANPYCRFCP